MEYLYILVADFAPCLKVGITNNIKNRLFSIENRYGRVNKKDSEIYSHPNRKILLKIEQGIHAYLDNYFYSTPNLDNGYTEWFCITCLDKCQRMIIFFMDELDDLNFEGNLEEVYQNTSRKKYISCEETKRFHNICTNFHQAHMKIIREIDMIIYINRDCINAKIQNECYILEFSNKLDILIDDQPKFKWVCIKGDKLFFNISHLNLWKRSNIHKKLCKLIEAKFFNRFWFSNHHIRLWKTTKIERNTADISSNRTPNDPLTRAREIIRESANKFSSKPSYSFEVKRIFDYK